MSFFCVYPYRDFGGSWFCHLVFPKLDIFLAIIFKYIVLPFYIYFPSETLMKRALRDEYFPTCHLICFFDIKFFLFFLLDYLYWYIFKLTYSSFPNKLVRIATRFFISVTVHFSSSIFVLKFLMVSISLLRFLTWTFIITNSLSPEHILYNWFRSPYWLFIIFFWISVSIECFLSWL